MLAFTHVCAVSAQYTLHLKVHELFGIRKSRRFCSKFIFSAFVSPAQFDPINYYISDGKRHIIMDIQRNRN